jgi:hypothetical protein
MFHSISIELIELVSECTSHFVKSRSNFHVKTRDFFFLWIINFRVNDPSSAQKQKLI